MRKNTQSSKKPAAPREGFLDAQREKLNALRAHLVRRTEKVDRDLARAEGSEEPDLEEQALARENDEVLAALATEGRDQLATIDEALARLDAGTYGRCERCGDPIARARLEARPYATTCVRCAQEQKG